MTFFPTEARQSAFSLPTQRDRSPAPPFLWPVVSFPPLRSMKTESFFTRKAIFLPPSTSEVRIPLFLGAGPQKPLKIAAPRADNAGLPPSHRVLPPPSWKAVTSVFSKIARNDHPPSYRSPSFLDYRWLFFPFPPIKAPPAERTMAPPPATSVPPFLSDPLSPTLPFPFSRTVLPGAGTIPSFLSLRD